MTGDRVDLKQGVVYGSTGSRDLSCNVFTPPGRPTAAPGVLLIHGGAWRAGTPDFLRGYGFLIGREGYVCVAPEYRLTTEARWPAQIHDVKAALRWMRANHESLGLDPTRIAVMGNSAGGHLALMLGATQNDARFDGEGGSPGASTDLAAVINLYGITSVEPGGDFLQEALTDLLGPDADRDAYREASPVDYVDERFPPTLILQSREDTVVPPSQNRQLYEALEKSGVPVELHMYDRVGHAFDETRELGREVAQIALVFLSRYMGPREAASK